MNLASETFQSLSSASVTRRGFLLGVTALGLAACSSGSATSSSSSTPATSATSTSTASASSTTTATTTNGSLVIPPLLTGTTFDISLSTSSVQYMPGSETPTYGYNGADFWGPTLVLKKGDQVTLNVTNNLTDETTTHWHGMHIPAEMDGGPHQVIAAGATWSPTFEVKNSAATYWYHPHMHETTQKQMILGAGGFIIVQDDEESALALPRTYGVDDIPLVLTSRRFTSTNEFDVTGAYGDYLLANGVMNATASLPAQMVRLRLLNTEIERYYNVALGGRTFYVIATDGGLLNAPLPVTELRMAPGERYEIVIDLSKDAVGTQVTLQAMNAGMPFGAGGSETDQSGEFGSKLNNTNFDLLGITVTAATDNAITSLPATLASNTLWTEADATNSRAIAITDKGPGSPFTFDNKGYSMETIDQTVKLDAVEKWTITNGPTFGHSFHIHDVQFAIVSRSTGDVADYEKGWKDTFAILPNESVTFVAKFNDFTSDMHPYMYHCHMANHEDGGLMGQFLVVA